MPLTILRRLVLVLLLLLPLGGCSNPPTLSGPGSYAVSTPATYTENRVLYLDDPAPGEPMRDLLHPYQILDRLRTRAEPPITGDLDPAALPPASARFVEHNQPLGVIVSGVWLPGDIRGRRDIAVILDLETSSEAGPQSIVVFYQRSVPGGQLLNFRDLLVYADPRWDSAFAPHFRLRVLDVATEQNQRTRELLDQVAQASAVPGALIPHPVVPGITLAIEAARQLLASRENSVILDYTVQLYSRHQAGLAGGADLGVLRTGSWLALGRPAGRGPEFWRSHLAIDRSSGEVLEIASDSAGTIAESPVAAPYFLLTVSAADLQVPRTVLDRSQDLRQLLRAPAAAAESGALLDAATALSSSIRLYSAERRLKRFRSIAALHEIVEVLQFHLSALERGHAGVLSPSEQLSLQILLGEITGMPALDLAAITNWWYADGINGRIIEAPDTPLGIRWAPSE